MTDPRRTPINARVADARLPEVPEGVKPVVGQRKQVAVPVADLLRAPEGKRDRQLLFGDTLTVFEDRDGWAFVQANKDGYVGYLRSEALSAARTASHWVSAASTHVYSAADMKSPELMSLSCGSAIEVLAEAGNFAETTHGFVPRVHLSKLETKPRDPVAVAAKFLGTPYLWGGNSRFGIDCSGLVQIALLTCGRPCPGDSDQQEAELGTAVPDGSAPQRGDLLFWKGHVAWVADADTLLHANAGHMAVAYEPLQDAIRRILDQGDGPVTSHKRL